MRKNSKARGRRAMKVQKRAIFLRYAVSFLLTGGVAVVIFFLKGIDGKNTKEILQTLHDAFFATGAFCLLLFGLSYVGSEGGFLGIGYALTRAARALLPFTPRGHETYAQYREKKTKDKQPFKKHVLCRLGIIFIIISLMFLWAWYCI